MVKVYLDNSVVIVYLFGHKTKPQRYPHVLKLFEAINADRIQALISVYTIQEICMYCYDHLPRARFAHTARVTLHRLLANRLGVVPLLTRMERTVNARKFPIRDKSDQPHVILAYLHKCEAIVAYDEHFRDTARVVPYLHPDELLARLESGKATNKARQSEE